MATLWGVRRFVALIALAAFQAALLFAAARPADAQGGDVLFLPMMAAPGSADGGGQTSAALIDAALARGEIDAETALVYKVFASFGDARLPAKYRGDGDELDAILLREAVSRYDTLSGQAQALLAPFFQPPIYQGSWYEPYAEQAGVQGAGQGVRSAEDQPCAFDPGPAPIMPGGWACADGMGANFRVWWRADDPNSAAKAQRLITALQNDIWPKLTILMRHDPPSDKGPHRFLDRNGEEQVWWDGGDGRLDIYLTWTPPGSGGAATIAYPPGCDKRPSFILVSPTMDDDTFIPAVTHEFFHTFQFGADQGKQCAEYEWWSEATANWAIDFVYPQDNWEHKWAYYFLQTRDWREPIRDQLLDGRSSYLFPLYLTKTTGDPGVIRRSWENAANFPNDSLAAIDQAIGGGLSDVWHEFALHVANVGPVDGFKRWDGIDFPLRGDEATGGEPVTEIVGDMPRIGDIKKTYGLAALGGQPDIKFEMPTDIPHLAMRAYRFVFGDGQTRSVGFLNPLLIYPQPDAKIQALVKVAGKEWQREDWTNDFARTFCREQRDEELEELIIVISNGQWRNRDQTVSMTPPPRLSVTNIGCYRWEGSFETTITAAQPGIAEYTDHYSGRIVFEPDDSLPENPIYQYYKLAEASVTWEQHGTVGECQIDGGPTTYSGLRQFSANLQSSSFNADKAMDYRIHTGTLAVEAKGTLRNACPGQAPFSTDKFHGTIAAFGQGEKPITADGLTLQGRHSESSGGVTTVTTWKLTAKPEQ
ncbi:MAG: hypothetical protein QM346_18035 [Chloroflexota bacterium]|nr:hypothetical protein [Chloroflexota bacterium]